MKTIYSGIAVCLALLATPAAAETARERADAIIAAAGAGDLFANVTNHDKVAMVRHLATGMTCTFTSESEAKIVVITDVLPRGEDVACDSRMGDMSVTLYATRMPGVPMEEELKAASEVVQSRWPKARKWKPTGASARLLTPDKWPAEVAHATNWFEVRGDEDVGYTRVSVTKSGDWMIKLRASAGPGIGRDSLLEILSDMIWLGVLKDTSASAKEATPSAP